MLHVLSVSLGSSRRDQSVQVQWLGKRLLIERKGTDGDLEKAAQLFAYFDGKVDAFGLGGADLAVSLKKQKYPFHSLKKMLKSIQKTPITDGSLLKSILEKEAGRLCASSGVISEKKVLLTSACSRWEMAQGFSDAGFDLVCGDLMFGLGLPFHLKTLQSTWLLGKCLLPIVTRVPFRIIYPIGSAQEKGFPKFIKWYNWSSVIAGDCHYIKRYLPLNIEGKIVVTNTTTEKDRHMFKERGCRYLVTTTPILEGRSFGANMIEASLIALAGEKRNLGLHEVEKMVQQLHLKLNWQEL